MHSKKTIGKRLEMETLRAVRYKDNTDSESNQRGSCLQQVLKSGKPASGNGGLKERNRENTTRWRW